MFYVAALVVLAVLCFLFHVYTSSLEHKKSIDNPEFVHFQRIYLTVYALGVAGDWLQGPYVYALYETYGMTKHQIELLFIAGFLSSLVFGTFVGSIADKFGRRLNCFWYAILYILSCITKHFDNFSVLLIGRITGGIATSILFSAFESWLINEHNQRSLNDEMLKIILSNVTLGNSIIAILAGIAAQIVANIFGYVAPFDCAIIVLLLMICVMMFTWKENFGDSNAELGTSFVDAYNAIKDDKRILFLGVIQSLFEGAMYTFVLEWTPALRRASSEGEDIPFGYIFAAFMFSIMLGSKLFRMLSRRFVPESFMRAILVISALTLATPILVPNNKHVLFIAFILFELCVGVFWPSMGYLRSEYVPEKSRSTCMNFFRVPLNIIVVAILCQNFEMDSIFMFCIVLLLTAFLFQQGLLILTNPTDSKSMQKVVDLVVEQENDYEKITIEDQN